MEEGKRSTAATRIKLELLATRGSIVSVLSVKRYGVRQDEPH